MAQKQKIQFYFLWQVLALIFIYLAIHPYDYFAWFLEISRVIIVLPILVCTYKKFPFTNLSYLLVLLHAIILMVGGHYIYADVPVFNWLRDTFDSSRNYYDRVGHFAQGFVPGMIAREILIRNNVIKTGAWLFFIVSCISLAISAC